MTTHDEKKYWKGLEELHETPEFLEERSKEFAEEIPLFLNSSESTLQSSRRDFLKIMGFTIGGAAISSACSRMPVEKAIPYLIKPEEITPGVANWYASTCAGCTAACGLLIKTRDGRPIKIEGNEESLISQGGVCAVGQASVLSLYDDTRLKAPTLQGSSTTWTEVDARIAQELSNINTQDAEIVFLSKTIVSPSFKELLRHWSERFPKTKQVTYDAHSYSAQLEACEKDFGIRALPHYHFDKAKIIVGLNADFLGTWISPVEFSRAYSQNRKPSQAMSRHIQFESGMSLTGANADHRFAINPSEEISVLKALWNELCAFSGEKQTESESPAIEAHFLKELAKSLWENRKESLVVSGTNNLDIQQAVNAINNVLSNIGTTVDLENPSYQKQGNEKDFEELVRNMNAGKVQILFLYGVNPAYETALAKDFVEGLKKVKLSVSFSDRADETSRQATIIAPDHHSFESWSDAEPVRGYLSLTQPVIRPLFSTRSAVTSLLTWMGEPQTDYQFLKNFWEKNYYPQQNKHLLFNDFWDNSVQKGFVSISQPALKPILSKPELTANSVKSASALELFLYEKVGIRTGEHANNPWLQELPDPVTKITWTNYLSVSPKLAKEKSLAEGDIVRLSDSKTSFEIPVHIQPGQASKTISIALGYGRTHAGKAANGVGQNATPLFLATNDSLKIEKTGKTKELAATQTHHSMEGRPIIKETVLEEYLKNPAAGNEEHEKLITLWEEWKHEGHSWGMAIDLNQCTGCSACLIGCQSENNVPVVGEDEVRRRREMHWIRIDRYYNGSEENPEVVHQPMMCQHCGNAPCETVCPVLATVHSSDGLNQQVYNRCVGTRYCANNCPYKVRRFNWFDYAHNQEFDYTMNNDLAAMVLNPDIVVRSRGVMEKCSLCVQRIQDAKLDAKKKNLPLKDGDIRLACEQSCPTQAIVFGDLNDSESRISKLQKNERFYHVLEEINVRPIVGYLTKVKNKV